jgi:hypothetical protein
MMGLSKTPADGINLPPNDGDFGTSRWGGSKLGYINGATGRKGHDRLWPFSDLPQCRLLRSY